MYEWCPFKFSSFTLNWKLFSLMSHLPACFYKEQVTPFFITENKCLQTIKGSQLNNKKFFF